MRLRIFQIVCVLFSSFGLFGCASTRNYSLAENWIDETTLQRIVELKEESKWIGIAGRPFVLEAKGDTLLYYYHFRSSLYKTGKDTASLYRIYKPVESDRTDLWAERNEIITVKVAGGQMIAIERDNKFNEEQKSGLLVETKKNENAGVILAIIGGAALFITILVTSD